MGEGEVEAWQAEPTARDLLTPELLRLLSNIPEPHAAKKRTTVRRLAFALANGDDVKTVFDHEDTCAEAIWYGKWKHDPDIAKAFEAYKARVLQWRDEETARIETHYRLVRLQKIAEHAADAPDALHEVMTGKEQRGSDRISAATRLISLADPETAERVNLNQPGGSTIEQTVHVEPDRITEIIRILGESGALEETGAGDNAPADEIHPAQTDA